MRPPGPALVFCHRVAIAAVAAVSLLASPAAADGSTMTYTSFANWAAATRGGGWLVDFSTFGIDTEFRTATIDAGPFSLGQTGGGNAGNFIDVPPFETSEGVKAKPATYRCG